MEVIVAESSLRQDSHANPHSRPLIKLKAQYPLIFINYIKQYSFLLLNYSRPHTSVLVIALNLTYGMQSRLIRLGN